MKGVILAGGIGSRLYPLTKTISKQLLPIYDKPMVYYPLSLLLLAGIRDIAIICTQNHIEDYKTVLGNGSKIGINIQYILQKTPNGLPEAFILSEEFVNGDHVCMILGDNILYGADFVSKHILPNIIEMKNSIFTYHVANPSDFGVINLDSNDKILGVEEKPDNPKSNQAITGLYIFDNNVSKYSKSLRPSNRGETEIVDLIQIYIEKKLLHVEKISRGVAWLDTGTHQNLIEAGEFIKTIENRQGLKVGCIEEIAYNKGYINANQLNKIISEMKNCDYKDYLIKIL